MSGPSSETQTSGNPARLFVLFLLFSTPIFMLLVYNTGWGNDQLEYLTIARAYSEGVPVFTYIHGKGIGIYLLLAGLMRLGYVFDHVGITAAIGAMYVLNTSVTYLVFSRHFAKMEALAAAALVGASALFMEQNFFQTEGFVHLSGLVAFHLCCVAMERNTRRNLILAGLVLAVGFHFKSVVAFYLVGIGVWGLVVYLPTLGLLRVITVWGLPLAAGFLAGALVPVAYFFATDRIQDFWEWTILFPLFHYPANTLYLVKFFTKLLWYVLTAVAALGLSLQRGVREEVYGRKQAVLALCMGLGASLVLLKGQGSHYVYPSAGFLLIFAVTVFHRCLVVGKPFRASPRALLLAAGTAGVLVVASVLLYRPSVVMRAFEIKDWSDEDRQAEFIQERVAPDEKVLFVTQRKCRLYWFSDRRPAMKSVSISVQSTYYFLRHPEVLLDALDDPDLTLVEFNPDRLRFEDEWFLDYEENRQLVEKFHQKLAERFEPAYQPNDWGIYFWAPKDRLTN